MSTSEPKPENKTLTIEDVDKPAEVDSNAGRGKQPDDAIQAKPLQQEQVTDDAHQAKPLQQNQVTNDALQAKQNIKQSKVASKPDIESQIEAVDELELGNYAQRLKDLDTALHTELGDEHYEKLDGELYAKLVGELYAKPPQVTRAAPRKFTDQTIEEQNEKLVNEVAKIKERIVAVEVKKRAKTKPKETKTVELAGATKTVELAHSYRLIRNLVRIEKHPVYKKALAEWESEVTLFESRVERKSKRAGDLKQEIYSVIGFYSVFQGVLLTATAQSSYLHCQNVGVPIALSAFASVGTLLHIWQKFQVISELQKTIFFENACLREVKSRVLALKEKGPDGFRFYDYQEDKEERTSRKFKFCGLSLRSSLVLLAILLFSVVFLIAHPLILCRPGPKLM